MEAAVVRAAEVALGADVEARIEIDQAQVGRASGLDFRDRQSIKGGAGRHPLDDDLELELAGQHELGEQRREGRFEAGLRIVDAEDWLKTVIDELALRDGVTIELDSLQRKFDPFTAKLTKKAYKTTPDDLEKLRAVGFDDRAILQITMIAAWFNYINRVADVLGVGR